MARHPKARYIYVGVDTHKRTHTAVAISCYGEKLFEYTFDNKPSAYDGLLEESKKHLKKGISPAFGLEDTSSSGRALAVYLLSHKRIVKKVDSSLTYSERRNQAITNKTDSFDALCIARILFSKFDELMDADPRDLYWTLKMLVGRRASLVDATVALKNQLHSYLVYSYPSYRQFFNSIHCFTALVFWDKYPSPIHLKEVTVEELGEFLREASDDFFSVNKAKEILRIIKSDGSIEAEYQGSRDFIIKMCVKEIRYNNEEIGNIEAEIKKLLKYFDYKLESMIGIDYITAAYFIAEIGSIDRFETPHKLAKYAGISPINYSSGDRSMLLKNQQGNRALYTMFHNLAARSISCGRNKDRPVNDIFYEYYQKKLSQGKTTHQAIICVMRRLVNIVYGLMKNRTEYKHPVLSNTKSK
ncbi:MAG: IS110 family RNA-guided transposase [Ruminiclostridium sp.]